MPHRRQRVERDQPDEAGDGDAAVLCPHPEQRDGEEGPTHHKVARAERWRPGIGRDSCHQRDIGEQDAAEHLAPLAVEMRVEVGPGRGIVGKDEAGGDEIDGGDDETAEEQRPTQRQQIAHRPTVHPESDDVARHEQAEQRGRPADADMVAGLQRPRQTAQPLGQRKAEDQPEQRKDEFEPAHLPPGYALPMLWQNAARRASGRRG